MRALGWSSVSSSRTTSNVREVLGALQDAESQTVVNVTARTDGTSVLIRTLRHTLYALLATVSTGRSFRLVQRVPNSNSLDTFGSGKRTKDSGSKIRDVASCVAPGNGSQSSKVRGNVESMETSGGRPRALGDVKVG